VSPELPEAAICDTTTSEIPKPAPEENLAGNEEGGKDVAPDSKSAEGAADTNCNDDAKADDASPKDTEEELALKHKVNIPSEYMDQAKEDPLAAFNKLMEAKDKEKGILDAESHYGPIPATNHPIPTYTSSSASQAGYYSALPYTSHPYRSGPPPPRSCYSCGHFHHPSAACYRRHFNDGPRWAPARHYGAAYDRRPPRRSPSPRSRRRPRSRSRTPETRTTRSRSGSVDGKRKHRRSRSRSVERR
jgi:hypothetical protein